MTYRLDRNRARRKYINIALGAVAFALFIYFWPAFRGVVYPLAEPLVRGYGGTKTGLTLVPSFISTYVTSHKTLSEQKARMETDVERLENLVAEKDAIIRELSSVSNALGADRTTPIVILHPIAQDITSLYSTILLSKGYREGIEPGSLVFIRGRQPVCEIVEVFDRTSLCELLSKGNRVTEGVTASSSITLSLMGEGGGSFIAEVPNGVPIQVGEDVLLRRDQSYKLGTVVTIHEDDQATGSKVYVRGTYNPVTSSLFYVHASYAP